MHALITGGMSAKTMTERTRESVGMGDVSQTNRVITSCFVCLLRMGLYTVSGESM